ncbi:g5279 [Coccomyxa viridis]|uniref:G5279 protein n=1 Tax=Coccomyxa viridis TaxID=1274662 RepID=A0ABP1FUQ2_9CHLO
MEVSTQRCKTGVGQGRQPRLYKWLSSCYYASGTQRQYSPGPGLGQWIIVYDAPHGLPMNQRFHQHVADTHLEQHIKQGMDDGLYISSVACYHDLWTLIMNNGTDFSAQVYALSCQYSLPEQWIRFRWRESFSISAVAGNTGGCFLVVMSKGTPYVHQVYKEFSSFPIKWISEYWRCGYYITSMAHSQSRWVIVMSKNAGFVDQCVELDFQHPSEGYLKWATGGLGYQITSVAATPYRHVAVLSIFGQQAKENLQEMKTSSGSPSAQINRSSANKQYVASIAYGRTAS